MTNKLSAREAVEEIRKHCDDPNVPPSPTLRAIKAIISRVERPPDHLCPNCDAGLPTSCTCPSEASALAENAIGLFLEYRDKHGCDEATAKAKAVCEFLDYEFLYVSALEQSDPTVAYAAEATRERCPLIK